MSAGSQLVGNAGLYYACYHLSIRGWNVMPTARNARGVDLVAYAPDGKRYVGVQVKALTKRVAVPLGKSLSNLMGDYWIIINKVATTPTAFILTPKQVAKGAVRQGQGPTVAYWLPPRAYDKPPFREAWGVIGRGDHAA